MLVSQILKEKGDTVFTVAPSESIAEVAALLNARRVGALVVMASGVVAGIVSERDVARHMSREGAQLLARPVSTIMTQHVRTCTPNETVEDQMRVMTRERIRHVPVVNEGTLVGIVSIGDVVENRVDELEGEREDLIRYIWQ